MGKIPKVSIVAPAFNGAKCIEDFIDSILSQNYRNWELIIVDDGSTDNTCEVVTSYTEKDSRIVLLRRDRTPKGSLTCRNIGIDHCTGEYIIHFDSDDIVEPFSLEQRVSFMEQNPDVDFATFKGESVYINQNEIKRTGRLWGVNPHCDILDAFLRVEYPFSVWNNIYRRESFKDYRWDENVKIYTDFSFIIPTLLGDYTHAFAEESKTDYLYRIGQKKAMTSNFIAEDKYESTKYLFEKTMKQIENLEKTPIYKESFKSFFLLQLQRVFLNGNRNQVNDYAQFFTKWYPNYGKNRVKFLSFLVNQYGDAKKSRIINMWYYLLFNPHYLLTWIRERKKDSSN